LPKAIRLSFRPHRGKKWLKFYKDLWIKESQNETDPELNYLMIADPIELEELEETSKSFWNRKSPGKDGMNTGLRKRAPMQTKER
jgi:hypothetical protein